MMKGIWAHPLSFMRCHLLNYGKIFNTPRIVFSFVWSSFALAHLFIISSSLSWICFDLAPFQLSPNSWKLALALFVSYGRHDPGALTMESFSCFLSLHRGVRCFYYFVTRTILKLTGFSDRRVSHDKTLKILSSICTIPRGFILSSSWMLVSLFNLSLVRHDILYSIAYSFRRNLQEL